MLINQIARSADPARFLASNAASSLSCVSLCSDSQSGQQLHTPHRRVFEQLFEMIFHCLCAPRPRERDSSAVGWKRQGRNRLAKVRWERA